MRTTNQDIWIHASCTLKKTQKKAVNAFSQKCSSVHRSQFQPLSPPLIVPLISSILIKAVAKMENASHEHNRPTRKKPVIRTQGREQA